MSQERLTPKRLMALGLGPDGAAYVGLDADGQPILVHRLKASIVADPIRRRRLERRLAFEQAATASASRGIEALLAVELTAAVPIVVVARGTTETFASRLEALRASPERGMRVLLGVATALMAAHAEGIAHGDLGPPVIHLSDDDQVSLSVLGLSTGADAPPAESWVKHFGAEGGDSANDARAFGGLTALLALDETNAWRLIDAPTSPPPASPSSKLLTDLARQLLDPEPAWRPSMQEVVARLTAMLSLLEGAVAESATVSELPAAGGVEAAAKTTASAAGKAGASLATSVVDDDEGPDTIPMVRRRIGRFLLQRPLGQGAMGQVWQAVDDDSGEAVAIKLLSANLAPTEKAKRRFRKEARLLSELRHPGIARFLESGDHKDSIYLATELVRGKTLAAVVRERGPLAEREATAIIADLARALIDVHDNGIVHRDIKPDNIIATESDTSPASRIKLIDFGVARHLDEDGSLAMTRQGAVLGTPLYMAPEQASGKAVDARSDIYAVGTLLYELLIGEAPFAGRGVAQVLAMQIEVRPGRVSDIRSDLSDEVTEVVARCLEKHADDRYQDARELLAALLPLTGQASAAEPAAESPTARRYSFTFQLQASPSSLWPFVSNTARLRKGIGIGAVEESVGATGGEVARFGKSTQVGFPLAWQEHPYEWIYERRLGVLREYSEGPLRSLRSSVELAPEGGGTRLVHTIEVDPRGFIGKAAAAVEIGLRTRRALERTYARIDALLQGRLGTGAAVDAFEEAPALASNVEVRIAHLEAEAVKNGASPQAIEAIGSFLRLAPAQEVARIRPIALARRFNQPVTTVIDACYHAASVGMLKALWDLLCPTCRVPSSIEETLRALRGHGRCEVCNLEFSLDLASSIELVFQAHPQIRNSDVATYCISSPAHTPHVMAQLRLPAGGSMPIDVQLPEGQYQLVSRSLAAVRPFRVRASAPVSHLEVVLSRVTPDAVTHTFPLGRQLFTVTNDTDRAHLMRIERMTPRDDVLTGVRALSSSLFKRLFPGEVLSDGAMVRVAAVTLLIIEPAQEGANALAIEELYALYRSIDDVVASAGGAVIRLHGEGVLSAFDDAAAAVCAVAALGERSPHGLTLRAAIHRAAAGAVTLNERLDYFGTCVHEVIALLASARPGELLVSDIVSADPAVAIAIERLPALEGTLDDLGFRRRLAKTMPTIAVVGSQSGPATAA